MYREEGSDSKPLAELELDNIQSRKKNKSTAGIIYKVVDVLVPAIK